MSIGYTVTAATSVTLVSTDDPFFDPYCWSNCTDNSFLMINNPSLARLSEQLWRWMVIVVGVLSVLAAGAKFIKSSQVARRLGWVTTLTAALALGAEVAYAASLLINPAENPEHPPFHQIFFIQAGALIALASGVIWLGLQNRRRRGAVVRLINDLEAISDVGSLQTSMAQSLGDGSLTVAYWLAHTQQFVDAAGHPVHIDEGPDRLQTVIRRGDATIAVISHDRMALDDHALEERIGSAALLALDNERLVLPRQRCHRTFGLYEPSAM